MTTKKLIKASIRHAQMTPAPVVDARVLANGNIVLVFQDAEVIMPGNWRLDEDLYVGDACVAYWDEDGRFHLERGC